MFCHQVDVWRRWRDALPRWRNDEAPGFRGGAAEAEGCRASGQQSPAVEHKTLSACGDVAFRGSLAQPRCAQQPGLPGWHERVALRPHQVPRPTIQVYPLPRGHSRAHVGHVGVQGPPIVSDDVFATSARACSNEAGLYARPGPRFGARRDNDRGLGQSAGPGTCHGPTTVGAEDVQRKATPINKDLGPELSQIDGSKGDGGHGRTALSRRDRRLRRVMGWSPATGEYATPRGHSRRQAHFCSAATGGVVHREAGSARRRRKSGH